MTATGLPHTTERQSVEWFGGPQVPRSRSMPGITHIMLGTHTQQPCPIPRIRRLTTPARLFWNHHDRPDTTAAAFDCALRSAQQYSPFGTRSFGLCFVAGVGAGHP